MLTYYDIPDKYDRDMVIAAGEFFLSKLVSKRLINNLNIEVNFVKGMVKACKIDACMNWEDRLTKPREFSIDIDASMPIKKALTTLAHELVHVKQYAIGEMRDKKGAIVEWLGVKYDQEELDYWDHPWEIDAFGREAGLYVRFMKFYGEKNEKAKKKSRKA